jgi:putative membrane protein
MKKSKLLRFVSVPTVAACCFLGQASFSPAHAQAVTDNRTQTTENRGQLSSGDYKFAIAAYRANTSEINLGQLAAQKATDPAVRQFAQRMVTDHTRANQQLNQLLSQKGVTVPSETSSTEEREIDRLQKLSGVDFDKAYMEHMVKDHKKDVKEFERAADKTTDTDLKAFAANTLPILQDHLKMAQDLETTVKAEKRAS